MNNESEEKKEKPGFWMTVSSFIVNKRKAIILLFIFAAIYSVICMNKVSINQDITSYLPATSETRVGLTTMEDQFVTYGSARVMVCNITYEEAELLKEQIEEIEDVKEVSFDDSSDHYKKSSALFDITLNGGDDDRNAIDALYKVEDILSNYDVYVSSSVGATEKSMASLNADMNVILVLAVLIIVAVLFISTKSFMEIPVLLITFGMAALLNKGSNFWLGEISSVTDSIAVVLQLALAIDYAIILCDRYMEEHETLEPIEAVKVALSKAIPEISSSSLTTVSGMAAMMFMQFKLGFDMGIVLVKAILFSLISVFLLMPGVILIFSKGIDKTMHRNYVPKITFVGKFASLTKYVIPPVFVLVICYAFYASSNCTYLYDVNSVESATKSESKIAEEKINDTFGYTNQLVVMVPSGDYEKEGKLITALENLDCVKSVTGLANQKVNDDYMVTTKINPRQFSEMTDLDIEVVRVLYMAYAYNIGQYGPVVTGIDDYSVPIIDMFLFLYDQYQEGYVNLDEDMDNTLNELYDKLHDGELQLKGDEYSRMVLNFDMPVEGEQTYEEMEVIRNVAKSYYTEGDVILVGNSTSAHDLSSSFATDNIIISVLTALFVLIILLFTFQSAGLPVLLVLTIQGSIWINFTVPALDNQGVYFIAYLIVSAIQMGATIDYAIVISSRYLALKPLMGIKDAITETLNQAFPTIFTSGTILTCAGFLIGQICSDATVAAIGVALGRGTLISIILVLFVLPQILLLGDVIIEKTALNVKIGGTNMNMFGRMVVNGYVRGEFTGRIDGEVKGVLEGRIDGSIDTRLSSQSISIEEVPEEIPEEKPEPKKEPKLYPEILILILGLALLFPMNAKAAEIETEPEIQIEEININSVDDFLSFAENCKYDAYSLGTIVKLNTDIDLSDTEFEGIPYFNGTFEGKYHKITGLNLKPDGSNYGLFRYVGKYGIVKNLKVFGSVNATGTGKNIGGIAGTNRGIISHCEFKGSVDGEEKVGGIAGANESEAVINDCSSYGLVIATNSTGGIAGSNSGTISKCKNYASVNVNEVSPTLDVGGVDLGSLNLTQNIYSRNDMGGISGISSGIITSCTNEGSVGYEHSGYNVGGICGNQCGVIIGCKNKGTILGRKDVGGIVGQAEPYVESEYLQDTADDTKAQVDELNNTLSGINSTIKSTSNKTADYATKISKTTAGQTDKLADDLTEFTDAVSEEYPEAKEYCNNINQAVDNMSKIGTDGVMSPSDVKEMQDNLAIISANLSAIQNVMDGSSSEAEELLRNVSNELKNTTQYDDTEKMINTINNGINSVSNSVDKAMDQIEGIRNTISDATGVLTGDTKYITDISSVETAVNMDGVVSGCTNEGIVRGDINVGGIAGTMNMEFADDPEYDFDFTSELSLVLRSTVNDVLIDCKNYGRVFVKKNYAGGITGHESLGIIANSENYGNVNGSEGNYLGGIAGLSETTISSCYVLCTLTGEDYVGGIAGSGVGVSSCVTVPTVYATGEAVGSVLGCLGEGAEINENVFCNETYHGIDNISYAGMAEPMTYKDILELEGVPERFKKVTVYFEMEDVVMGQETINYGDAINKSHYPTLVNRTDSYIIWKCDGDTDYVTENLVLTGEYINWTTSVAATEKNEEGRCLFIAVGEFYKGTEVTVKEVEAESIAEDNSLKSVAYAYSFDIYTPIDKKIETVEGHFLIPSGADSAELWIKEGEVWKKASPEIDGSYLVCDINVSDSFAVIAVTKEGINMMYVYIAVTAAVIVALIIMIIVLKVKSVKKKVAYLKEIVEDATEKEM